MSDTPIGKSQARCYVLNIEAEDDMSTYSYTIEELDGSFRGCRHQAVIYRDGKRVSSHRTKLGEAAAKAEAEATIKFYQKAEKRDQAAA